MSSLKDCQVFPERAHSHSDGRNKHNNDDDDDEEENNVE